MLWEQSSKLFVCQLCAVPAQLQNLNTAAEICICICQLCQLQNLIKTAAEYFLQDCTLNCWLLPVSDSIIIITRAKQDLCLYFQESRLFFEMLGFCQCQSSSPERANTIQMSTKASLSNWYLSSYLYLYYLYLYLNLYLSLYLNLCTLYVWLNHHHHRESTLFMCQRRQFSQTGIWTLTQLRRLTLLGFAQWLISKFCLTNNKTPKPFFCLLRKS